MQDVYKRQVYTILNMVEIANGTIRLDEKGEEA